MVKWLRFKRWLGFELKPHEKALLGDGAWGRQAASAKVKATVGVRVYRAATDTWEEVS